METNLETKTHYRKVMKSDHFGVEDLEILQSKNIPLIFKIKEVKQEYNVVVAGRKGDFNIAYFVQNIEGFKIKPMVLNAGNSAQIKAFNDNSPFVEDWTNTIIQMAIVNVKFGKDWVLGCRILEVQPKEKTKAQFTEANFEKAKNAKATIETIKKAYSITSEMETKYTTYVKAK